MTLYQNGASVGSGAGSNGASTAPFAIGYWPAYSIPFEGLIGEVYLYSSALSSANRTSIDTSESRYFASTGFATPYSGASVVQFGPGEDCSAGHVLDFEHTQPFTAFAAIQMYNMPNTESVIIDNDDPGNNYAGYQLVVNGPSLFSSYGGRLLLRLMNNVFSTHIDVVGSTNVADGKKHFVAVSYDGSGLAAGVKLYVDGVQETMTTLSDTLSGTMVSSGQTFLVGDQYGNYTMHGSIGHVQIDTVARSPSYIASYSTPSSLPPIDAKTAISLSFTEGSGTTAADASGNNHNCTLSSANMWVP